MAFIRLFLLKVAEKQVKQHFLKLSLMNTQNLIKAAKSNCSAEVLVLDAHKTVCAPTVYRASKLGEKQNPDYKANPFIPKEKQLILSISTFHLQG